MSVNEPCSICEEYIEGVICDKDKCPVGIMKKECAELQRCVSQHKSEAIKEFAERLKEKAYLDGAVSISQELVVDVRDVDDLVEEMTEDEGNEKIQDYKYRL